MIYTDLADAPEKHYGVILADPAWKFRTYAPPKDLAKSRAAERHYPTMTLDEIKALPVARAAARDCWLFMWCTWPHLQTGLAVLKAWGFHYSSSGFVWFKMKRSFSPTRLFVTLPDDMHIGSGYTTRKNTEFVLLGRRGSPKRMAADVWEPIFAPVREHSRKPDEQYHRIERFAAGPYLELNARNERPGWDQWGNEVQKFEQPNAGLALPVEPEPEQMMIWDRPKALPFTVLPGLEVVDDGLEIPPFLKRMIAE